MRQYKKMGTAALLAAAAIACASAAFAVQLVMVDQKGCHYCEAWMEEIGPTYPNTAEGRYAPLSTRDISLGAPDGAEFSRRVNFTPTFILLEQGAEIGRIEGYPGEDFFWPVLNKLLTDTTDFDGETR